MLPRGRHQRSTTRAKARGCFVALGKTAELEVKSIEAALRRLRELLGDWDTEYQLLYEDGDSGLPEAGSIQLSKLAAGSLMSDNAAAAVATSKLIVDHILEEITAMAEEGDESLEYLPVNVRALLDGAGLDAASLLDSDPDFIRELLGPLILTWFEVLVSPTRYSLSRLTEKQLEALMSMVRRRRAYYAKKDLGTIHEQRRLASERAAEKAAKIQERLDAQMRKNWELVLGTKVDSKEEVEAKVTRLLQESQKNKKIKNKEDKAISYLWKQIKLYEAFGKSEFGVVKKGKTAQQLMKHVVDKIGDGVDLPDEPVLLPLENKTLKVLGTVTAQALREADEASRSNHERAQAARAKAAASLLEAAKKQKEPKKRQGPRLRNREKPTRVPCPSIDDRLVGQALEFAFGWDEGALKVA